MTEEFTPVFNFDGELTDVETLNELEAQAQGGKVFRPGEHNMIVSKVSYGSPGKNPGWFSVRLEMIGTGNNSMKKISTFLSVPKTNDLTYIKQDGKKSAYPYIKLRDTLGALGIALDPKNVASVVKTYFAPEVVKSGKGGLVGRETIGVVGYRNAHATYVAGPEGEDGSICIRAKNGDLILDTDGAAMKFDDYQAAEAYATTNNIAYDAFPDLLELKATAANSSDEASGSW